MHRRHTCVTFTFSSIFHLDTFFFFFFFNDTATTEIYTLSLHDALPISDLWRLQLLPVNRTTLPILRVSSWSVRRERFVRSEEHTSELQSRLHLVCRLLLEKKKKTILMRNANYGHGSEQNHLDSAPVHRA